MFSSCLRKNWLIRAWNWSLKWFKFMHVGMFFICLKSGFKLSLFETPLGFDFTNWALNHVKEGVLRCFLENWPKRIEIYGLKLGFELEVQIWNFQNLDSRSSGVTGARAWKSCSQHFVLFWNPLERNNWRSSGTLCLMLERVSSAQSSVIFTYPALLTVLQNARAGYSTLERKPLSACPLERSNLRSSVTPVF